MKTVAVLNFKGGVGKTVTTATLAYLLAKQGKRILLIDGDSQGNLSMSFGIEAEEGADTLALLTEGAGYDPEFVTPTIFDGIDLIPSDINLLVADRHMAQSGVGRMQRAIADLRDAIEEDADQDNAYDLILIDCPPALSAACTAALAAADEVIIPIRLDYYSTGGMANLAEQLQHMRAINPRLSVLGVLVTQFTHMADEKEALAAIRGGALPVFETVIRFSKAVPSATFQKVPLPVARPYCAASKDYAELVKEISGRC